MATPASVARHPLHPMLVTLPIGLWVFSLIADVVHAAGWGPPVWKDVAFYTLAGGLVGAVLAAVPGLIDLVSMPRSRARSLGLVHMVVNGSAVVLFAVNLWLRTRGGEGTLPLVLSVVGVGLIAVGGWLGGELVYVYGVGVEREKPPVPRARDSRAA